jgi:hypothetical protein
VPPFLVAQALAAALATAFFRWLIPEVPHPASFSTPTNNLRS